MLASLPILLRQMLGPSAQFRPGQSEAITALVTQRKRLLVVQQTGWGKSLVYFLATRLLRDQGSGPTLLVSPLLSLMRDQIDAAQRIGIRAATLNSTNLNDWGDIEQELRLDNLDILLVSPERLANDHFLQRTLPAINGGIGLLVVDEAHCISDWGHDFRPDYKRIVRIVQQLPPNIPVLGTTATANNRVVADVAEQLGPDLQIMRGPLTRASLRLQTISLADQSERMAWIAEHLPALPGTGIIYCLTVADCIRVSRWLDRNSIDAPAYYAGISDDQKLGLEQKLRSNQVKALVATVALGMGYDKPDLGFVVHFQRPGSVVAYYQQIGRAGRAVETAYAVLLSGKEDDEIQDYFINRAFPAEEDCQRILGIIEDSEAASFDLILAQANIRTATLTRILKLLEIGGAVAHDGKVYFRTPNPWQPDTLNQRQVTEKRKHEVQRMQDFIAYDGCLMEFIARELDDPWAQPCGRCSGCVGDFIPRTANEERIRDALSYLSKDYQTLEPRKQLPALSPGDRRRKISNDRQIEVGQALCIYGDAVWGRLVQRGKYETNRFDDRLVRAAAELITKSWKPSPAPAWVTAVPSKQRPTLVPDFAMRLAHTLNLPFFPVLEKVRDTPMQKTMQNSSQQAQNVIEAFAVQSTCPQGPVLLVDDVVDSRWTLTICGMRLREAGSGPVYPFALASAAVGGDID